MRHLILVSLLTMTTALVSAREILVYIGTYTKGSSQGIYVGKFDTTSGKLGELSLAAEASNPSFVALSPDRRFLYAVSEGASAKYNGKSSGAVSAYSLSPVDGTLTFINSAASAGKGPCHVSVSPDGKSVLVANYSSGTVSLLPVRSDGGLDEPASVDQHEGKSIHPSRQKGPYAHSINPSADGRLAVAADLGTDKVYTYRIDGRPASLALASTVSLTPGSGPRHSAFSPDGSRLYVINELANTITSFAVDADTGALTTLHTAATLPEGFQGETKTAEVAVHPSGRFVYGSNRGHDSIAVFKADPASGELTVVEHVSTQGKNPRHFSLDPTGGWLIAANQDGDSLVVFKVDSVSGRLAPTGQVVNVDAPVCVRFY